MVSPESADFKLIHLRGTGEKLIVCMRASKYLIIQYTETPIYVDEANHLSVADATLEVIELQSNPTVVAIGFSRPSS